MDIILKHLVEEREKVESASGHMDVPALSVAIWQELQENFRITAYAAQGEESARTPIMVPSLPEGTEDITIRASGNPMLWYVGTDLRARRLDDGPMFGGGAISGREAQIALALTDIGASRLHEVTL
jgi:hypothetical protein